MSDPELLPQPTPSGRVMVVSLNLASGPFAPAPSGRFAAFARRVAEVLPHAPDVVLLQEASKASAERVARQLSRQGFGRYRVSLKPKDRLDPTEPGGPEIVGDTGILLSQSMERLSGGTIQTTYEAFDRNSEKPFRTKINSWIRTRRIGGGTPLQLASVHFVINEWLNPENIGLCYKSRWTDEVAGRLDSLRPSPEVINVICGDFNNRRCFDLPDKDEKVACEAVPFWHRLTSRWGYKDAIFSVHGTSDEQLQKQLRKGSQKARRIDYVFTTGGVVNASHDVTYDAQDGDPDFYSDHRLLWALLDTASGED